MELPDGRRVQLWTGGASAGPAVLVCHGTPDTRWVARTGESAAFRLGVRLVSVNRPGYGSSTPTRSTSASVADDCLAVLDVLGVDRVGVVGMSVGSLYAAALAARHPDRVTSLAVVAAPTETRTATGPIEALVEKYRPEFAAGAASMDVADPDDEAVARRWLAALPPADAGLLASLGHEAVAASAREALARHDGYLRDAAWLFSDWAIDWPAIRCPAQLCYGTQDDRNPPEAGRWWADRIPHAELTVTETTHLATLLLNWPRILEHLRAGARKPRSG